MPNHFPFAGLEFKTRDDVQAGFRRIFDALVPSFSEGKARVRTEMSASFCDVVSAELEGFSRPLWGLVPYVAGGGHFEHWHLYHEGLANGTNPDHPEYWGDPEDMEQKLVEFAAIGLALALIPEHFYEPIPEADKPHVLRYFVAISNKRYPLTNWKWFHVFLTIGLDKIGCTAYDQRITTQNLKDMDEYYLSEGWYGDGPQKNAIDYYNPWAFHMYGVMYAQLNPSDTERVKLYLDRAQQFARQFYHWNDDAGSALPYGRSLTYKFASGSFWGSLPFANSEMLPWGVVKGLYLRHLRWWRDQPFGRGADSDVMSLGYAYPNAIMCERYNAAQSPYWGTKIFLPLALPESHPFWQAEEVDFDNTITAGAVQPVPGMVFTHFKGNTRALVSGPYQNGSYVRFQGEKYCKFAYSTRYGFSVEVNDRDFVDATLDNMIGFSEDGHGFRFRVKTSARIAGDVLYSTWEPWADVQVETWLIPHGQWHVRVHRIKSGRDLIAVEGGFAIPALAKASDIKKVVSGSGAYCISGVDFSGAVDLTGVRRAHINLPEPNTNIMVPKTVVPHLTGTIKKGVTAVLGCAVLANPDVGLETTEWNKVPAMPSDSELEAWLKQSVPVLAEKE